MVRYIPISDEGYLLVSNHAFANGESITDAMDELFAESPRVWLTFMPEMRKAWVAFKNAQRSKLQTKNPSH